jgi:plastocyanin
MRIFVLALLMLGVVGQGPILDQFQLTYIPESQTVAVGEKVLFMNSDEVLHNVHAYLGKKTAFNWSIPPGASMSKTFKEAGEYTILCDLHPNMFAYITVEEMQ